MFENHAPEAPDGRNAEHDLWLAMQAAYKKYTDATAALDAVTSQVLAATPCSDGRLGIEKAASEQRNAFENYMEARMQFAECRYDRNNAGMGSVAGPHTVGGSTLPNEEKSTHRPWAGFTDSRLALPAAAVALLCTVAFTFGYLVRAQRHVRDSDAARDEIRATLNQTRDGVQAVVRKFDALNVTQQLVIRESAGAPAAPVRPQRTGVTRAAVGKPAEEASRRSIQAPVAAPQKWRKIPRNHQEQVHQVQNLGDRSYYEFSLTLSRHFKRIGPLSLSLRMVNPNEKYFDLCIMADDLKLRHVKLHKAVRINLSDPSRRVDLVASRIDKNHVQGYFSVIKSQKADLTAGQLRRRPAGGS